MLPGRSMTTDVCIAYSAESDEVLCNMQGGQGECTKNSIVGNTKSRNPLRSDFYWYGGVKLWVQEFGRGMLFIPSFSRRKRRRNVTVMIDVKNFQFRKYMYARTGKMNYNTSMCTGILT